MVDVLDMIWHDYGAWPDGDPYDQHSRSDSVLDTRLSTTSPTSQRKSETLYPCCVAPLRKPSLLDDLLFFSIPIVFFGVALGSGLYLDHLEKNRQIQRQEDQRLFEEKTLELEKKIGIYR